jgi:hypothetical protein
MPANVVVKPRANVTAGFANEVEDVNGFTSTRILATVTMTALT